MAPPYNVAVLLYPSADIVDFSGPLEIYSCRAADFKTQIFKTTTFACQNSVRVGDNAMTLVPDASLEEIRANLKNYDLLVVPGAAPDPILELVKTEDGKAIFSLIQEFASLPPRQEAGQRVIQSVCTGALLLAGAGILAGRTVTTHHMFYDLCKQMADEAAGEDSKTTVIAKRWVDAGVTDAGVRIVNAGGVTSGIDTSLFVVESLAGKEHADWVAEIVEFEKGGQDDAWGSKE
ncbi:class I glutamine amidotransferase-like protein [Westerdykella ornata]|uniref:Class I glutamine amidotransferase-like protein n=1 Tax=Westerdykella ornata TaxID=318751 RepID=A0A6A6J5Z0_WESOR|nr:class I glutamine amidotransferase-like protein [Westerdykella ornata]KAF2271607.1 class I glutamine amidotransferase-like protein [Westerdykella ornata]